MEDFNIIQGVTSIFGFLSVCVIMIWKVVSDKKEDDKTKDVHDKITRILEYITTEKEGNERKMNELQRQIEQNTKAIGEISDILGKISAKLSKMGQKSHKNNLKTSKNED